MFIAEYLFLALLVLLSYVAYKAKGRYFVSQQETYNKIMIGLGFWLLLMLVRIAGANGLLPQFVAANYAAYQSVLEAVLLVSGGVFLGVSMMEWIPRLAAAEMRANLTRNHLNLLTSIVAARHGAENRRQMLEEIKRLLRFSLGAAQVQFYDYEKSNSLLRSCSYPATAVSRDSQVYSWCHEAIAADKPVLVQQGLEDDGRPVTAVALDNDDATSSVMLIIWDQETILTPEIQQLLGLISSQLTAATGTAPSVKTSPGRMRDVFAALREKLATRERVADQMNTIDRTLRELIDYDILRIAIYDPRGLNVNQYCLGRGKNLLTERDKSISTNQTRLGELFDSQEVTHATDLAASSFEDDRWLASCGAKAAVSIPLCIGKRTLAVLTIAASSQNLTSLVTDEMVSELVGTLLPLIQTDILSHELVSYNRRILDIAGALKSLVSAEDYNTSLKEFLDTVVRKLPAAFGRLWRYDPQQERLKLVTESGIRDFGGKITNTDTLSLADTYWHKLVLETGRMIVIDQKDERMRMDDSEQQQTLLPGLRSALLVPLMADNQPLGIMALAEMRQWERRSFTLPETLFARAMGNIVAQTFLAADRSDQVRELSGRINRLEKTTTSNEFSSDLSRRLTKPLTTIMTETERLIKSRLPENPRTIAGLNVINRQAEKVIEEVQSFQERRAEEKMTV
ncbi:MAG: GAF domain-containing protein [candidate division Zixibacteria bacterium]|nr:GAF domain-containing protein [candidate division Zixibacteria bacterium]